MWLQTDLLSPLSSVLMSDCGSVVKSMASRCPGCVLPPVLPPCGPSAVTSNRPQLPVTLPHWAARSRGYFCSSAVRPPISSSSRLLPASFPISASNLSCCLFLQLPSYLLSCLSPYLQNKLRLLDESCSYSELWPAFRDHSKTKSAVVACFRNVNIIRVGFQSSVN